MALAFKALRRLRPDDELWRDFTCGYEGDGLAIDLMNSGELLRQCVDDARAHRLIWKPLLGQTRRQG